MQAENNGRGHYSYDRGLSPRTMRASKLPAHIVSIERYLAPSSGAYADSAGEHAGKVALVDEGAGQRARGQRRISLPKQSLGRFDTGLEQPGMRSKAG